MPRAAWLTIIFALPALGAAPQKPFVDCTQEELIRAVPELAGIQFDSAPDRLDPLLHTTGENLKNRFAKLVNFSAAEDIHELRFDPNFAATARHEAFRYAISLLPGGEGMFQELRIDPSTQAPVSQPAAAEFLVLSYFYKLLDYVLPQNQNQSRFRYLGRLDSGGQHLFVIALAQKPDSTLESHLAIGPNGQTAKLQGLVWIDATTGEIVRLRMDLLEHVENFPFETVTTDISYTPVDFKGRRLLLPNRVTAHATSGLWELHSVQRYSGYEAEGAKGTTATNANDEDSYELLAKGIALIDAGNSTGAIPELRKALLLNPGLPAAHFQLASTLLASNDLAGAETELHAAVKLAPDSVVAHNLLGIVLGKRGDHAGAVAELRTSARMLPNEPTVHYNLAQALERSGDRPAALAEYRTASAHPTTPSSKTATNNSSGPPPRRHCPRPPSKSTCVKSWFP